MRWSLRDIEEKVRGPGKRRGVGHGNGHKRIGKSCMN